MGLICHWRRIGGRRRRRVLDVALYEKTGRRIAVSISHEGAIRPTCNADTDLVPTTAIALLATLRLHDAIPTDRSSCLSDAILADRSS
jgi:hypothetical protein